MTEFVVLVDEYDNETGIMEKQEAHLKGVLHRAISVFIFNSKGELLLQQRAEGKYHSANLWTNTCCSHPRQGEKVHDAAIRRLYEEMGLRCDLKEVFSFVYKAKLDRLLTEHEYDHVFIGMTNDIPVPDGAEVAAWRYINAEDLAMEIKLTPGNYTAWFKICFHEWGNKLFVALPRSLSKNNNK